MLWLTPGPFLVASDSFAHGMASGETVERLAPRRGRHPQLARRRRDLHP
jgi:hypothetical protein